MKHALDVQGLQIVRCSDIDILEEHPPKRPPFFSKVKLWFHPSDNYVVWLQRASHGTPIIRFFMRIDPSNQNKRRVGGEISSFTITPLHAMLWKQFRKYNKEKKERQQNGNQTHAIPAAADDDVVEPAEGAAAADDDVAMAEPAEGAVAADADVAMAEQAEAPAHPPPHNTVAPPPTREGVEEDVAMTATAEDLHARIFGADDDDDDDAPTKDEGATGAASARGGELLGSDGDAPADKATDTADELQNKIEELQNKLKHEELRRAEESTRAENERSERLKVEQRHAAYIKRTCKERKELRQEKIDAEEKEKEAQRKKQEAEEAVKSAWAQQKMASATTTANTGAPPTVYVDLIKLVHTKLTAEIASVILRRKPTYVTVRKPKQKPAKRAKPSSSSSSRVRMTFWVDLSKPGTSGASWTLLTTKAVCSKLNDLVAGKVTVAKYNVNEHPYETTLVRQYDSRTSTCGELLQKNVGGTYATQRMITFEPSKNIDDDEDEDEDEDEEEVEEVFEPKDKTHALTVHERDEIQFGNIPFIEFDKQVLARMHEQVRQVLTVCDVNTDASVCVELSNLAYDYVALGVSVAGNDAYTYNPSKTEIWIKPQVLYGWLSWAKEQQMFHAVVCLHGATEEGYKGMRKHMYGFDMKMAGSHGRTYGDGWYLGRSIHVTTGYNLTSADYPQGTAIMALALTTKDIAKQSSNSYHGGYKAANSTSAGLGHDTRCFSLSNPTLDKTNCPERKTRDNCLLLHDARLALPLGLIVAMKK